MFTFSVTHTPVFDLLCSFGKAVILQTHALQPRTHSNHVLTPTHFQSQTSEAGSEVDSGDGSRPPLGPLSIDVDPSSSSRYPGLFDDVSSGESSTRSSMSMFSDGEKDAQIAKLEASLVQGKYSCVRVFVCVCVRS